MRNAESLFDIAQKIGNCPDILMGVPPQPSECEYCGTGYTQDQASKRITCSQCGAPIRVKKKPPVNSDDWGAMGRYVPLMASGGK